MSLLREIQNDLATTTCDVTTVLRKCKILAARLGSREFANWVDFELNGYPASERTPDYRYISIRYYASFMNAAWQVNRRPIPLQLIPEENREPFVTIEFRDGISKATSFAASDHGARIERPELIFVIQDQMYPGMNCYAVWGEISRTEFEQLVSAVKNRILDFSLSIEAENPDAGEAPLNTRPVPMQKLQPLVQNIFYGTVGAVAQNTEHLSQTVNTGINTYDLARFVTQFSAHIKELNLDDRQKQRAEAQLATLSAESTGEPDPVIVKQAAHTLRNITEGAIGSLLATAAQPTVWQWIHQALLALTPK